MLHRILLLMLAGILCSTVSAQTKNASTALALPASDGPLVVKAAFHLLAIHEVDDRAETFGFSGVMALVWKDPEQAFDPAAEGVSEKLFNGDFQFNEMSPSWYPQLVLANAANAADSQGVLLRVEPDGTTTLIQTINAVVRSRMNLRRYPFDGQSLEANFEILGFDSDEVQLVAGSDAATADLDTLLVPQWDLTEITASTKTIPAPYVGSGGKSSVFVLTLDVERQSFFMLRLVILPLMLIVILSWSVFWMDRSSLGDRMSVSFVGILTAVAYQIMVSDLMPRIAYVTLMNAFLNLSFLLMCSTVVINLVVGSMDKCGHSLRGEKLDLRCRVVFPIIYVFLILAALALVFLIR